MTNVQHINGMRVVVLPDPLPGHHVLRTWRERWLTKPWQPLLYWRWVPAQERLYKKGQVTVLGGTIYCYREEWNMLWEQAQDKERARA